MGQPDGDLLGSFCPEGWAEQLHVQRITWTIIICAKPGVFFRCVWGSTVIKSNMHRDPWLEERSCSFQVSLLGGGREGGGEDPKNNSYLTHFAQNLTGLPARWGFACPIFLSIFSRDLMRAISLLG